MRWQARRRVSLSAVLVGSFLVCLANSACVSLKAPGERAVYVFDLSHRHLGPIFVYANADGDCRLLHAILNAWEAMGSSYETSDYLDLKVLSPCYAATLRSGGRLWAGEAANWGMAAPTLEICEGLLSGRSRLFQSAPTSQCFAATLIGTKR
jgi:hypothetical protein